MKTNEVVVDARAISPRERHPKIFNVWDSLAENTSLLLVNDHDPVPLYYQFAAEHRGGFRWEYLERGPDTWRVLISKGNYQDPGFLPQPRNLSRADQLPAPPAPPLELDVRPIFARGGSPCTTIDEAVASLRPGQSFVLLAPFEPAPLFGKLGAQGFSHRSESVPDGSWRITFTPTGTASAGGGPSVACCCSGH